MNIFDLQTLVRQDTGVLVPTSVLKCALKYAKEGGGCDYKPSFKELFDQSSYRQIDIARELGVSAKTVRHWISGNLQPSFQAVELVSGDREKKAEATVKRDLAKEKLNNTLEDLKSAVQELNGSY